MFLRLLRSAIITVYISTRFVAISTCLTGFSIIFIYLLFHRASFAPFITLDFYYVKFITSVFVADLSWLLLFVSKICTVISTYGYLSS